MPDDDSLENRLKGLFGEVVFRYGDAEAIEDGVLIPFVVGKRDTLHRITSNAFNELSDYHRLRSYREYEAQDFYRFYFLELLPLVPEAHRVWDNRSILRTTYDFEVTQRDSEILWYVPNEIGGITMMLPTDY